MVQELEFKLRDREDLEEQLAFERKTRCKAILKLRDCEAQLADERQHCRVARRNVKQLLAKLRKRDADLAELRSLLDAVRAAVAAPPSPGAAARARAEERARIRECRMMAKEDRAKEKALAEQYHIAKEQYQIAKAAWTEKVNAEVQERAQKALIQAKARADEKAYAEQYLIAQAAWTEKAAEVQERAEKAFIEEVELADEKARAEEARAEATTLAEEQVRTEEVIPRRHGRRRRRWAEEMDEETTLAEVRAEGQARTVFEPPRLELVDLRVDQAEEVGTWDMRPWDDETVWAEVRQLLARLDGRAWKHQWANC